MSVKMVSKGRLPDVKAAAQKILKSAAEDIKTEADFLAPKKQGNLRKALSTFVASNYAKVGTRNIPYAQIQEYGGVIRPKNKKSLAWKKGGKKFFAKKVTIKPQPYLIPAFKKIRDKLGGIITAEIEKTTK